MPYVAEAMVVGVADKEFGQRVAALIFLHDEELSDDFLETYGNTEYMLTRADVRKDLRGRLAGFRLPTLLRIVDGELPKSTTGKFQKKLLGPQFFLDDYQRVPEVQ